MEENAFPLYPEIDPYMQAMLDVGDGHRIYYEQCGNPAGQPVVFLHGGPGSGCTPGQRRFFDPSHYRIILFDQRGCGRSLPAGETRANTTQHLVHDIEALRSGLGISRWLVFGGSWGSTLALAYAARHPEAITGMILRGIFLSRSEELHWFLHDARKFFPEPWERLRNAIGASASANLLDTYKRIIFGADPSAAIAAARAWNAYEASIMFLRPPAPSASSADDASTLARARVQLHYLDHLCFVQSPPLLEQIDTFRHIRTRIIQGRYDMVCPPDSAYALRQAWPEAELEMIADAGHAAFEPGTRSALIRATEDFKSLNTTPGR